MKYVDIPNIPAELIEWDIDKILEIENEFQLYPHEYTSHAVSDELNNYLQQYFAFDIAAKYQVIHTNIPRHIDYDRTEAYNYILYAGGNNVHTRFWIDNIMISSTNIKIKRWHKLNVDTEHDVVGITSKRVALTVSL